MNFNLICVIIFTCNRFSYKVNFCIQLMWLLWRCALSKYRDLLATQISIVQTIVSSRILEYFKFYSIIKKFYLKKTVHSSHIRPHISSNTFKSKRNSKYWRSFVSNNQ